MKLIEFKGPQKQAIEARGSDILVSAGAGSGKTTVLVERVLNLITCDPPINIDRLLIATFTDAAAQHMKNSVAKTLSQRIKENPSNEKLRKNLQNQLALINKANIITIHSFCLMVARKFFHKIDMDPNFKIADDAEINLLKSDVLDALFEEKYLSHYEKGENIDFIRLAQMFDQRVGDENFRKAVLELHNYSRSAPNPAAWLFSCANEYLLENGFEQSIWYDYFINYATQKIDAALDTAKKMEELAQYPHVSKSYLEIASAEKEFIEQAKIALTNDFSTFCDAVDFKFGRLPGGKSKQVDSIDPEEIAQIRKKIKNLRDSYKSDIETIKKIIVKNPDATKDDLKNIYPIISALVQLVAEFSNRFQQEKKERGKVDFNDLEHFALNILVDDFTSDGKIVLSPEAYEIGAMFDEVFIDEYQDTNLMQEIVLGAVAEAGNINRFMVGDVKQCIYQFRMARPSIFNEKLEKFDTDSQFGTPIRLLDNYRSRQNVIDTINLIFAKLMKQEIGGIEYENGNALNFAASYSNVKNADFRTVLHIIDAKNSEDSEQHDETNELLAELSQAEIEAKTTAQYIAELLKSGFEIRDGDKTRPIQHSDIVILLRSKTAIQSFVDELKSLNIPAFSETANDYFLATEVMTILAILQIIDNPRQDIPLITALFSEIFCFKADDLVQINKYRRDGDFYDALLNFCKAEHSPIASNARTFLSTLDIWRKNAGFMPISQLIFKIYEDTGYLDFVGLLLGGKLRRANLMLLFEKAITFEEASYAGLFNFVRYIEKLQKTKFNLEKANVANENENLVRIMTIHKSKGLEFPVVFLCQAGKQFNLTDARRNMVMNFDLGIGLKSIDFERNISSQTFSRAIISKKIVNEQVSEELRVLYVALTRAKEKLYIIGSTKNLDKYSDLDGKPTPNDIASAKSYMDWILMTLGEVASDNIWDIRQSDTGFVRSSESRKQQNLLNVFGKANQSRQNTSDTASLYKKLEYKYPNITAQYIPAKMSVSEIKRLYFNELTRDSADYRKRERKEFLPPSFVKDSSQSKISAATKGIIIHTILEHLDFATQGKDEILELIDSLVTKKMFTLEEATEINVNALLDFLQSNIAERIRYSCAVYREVPFAVAMPPELINSEFGNLANPNDFMVVHGIIDCIFEIDNRLHILDYKTEQVFGSISDAAEKYRPQMELYQHAAEKIFSKKVLEKSVYFFDNGQCVVL